MVQLSLLRRPAFGGRGPVLVLAGFGLFGVFFFLSLYLQDILGLSAVQGGLVFMPMAAVLIIVAPVAARLATRWGAAPVVAAGMLVFGIGLAWISEAGVGSHYLDVLPGLVLAALGSALATPVTTAAIATVPPNQAGAASGALSTSRGLRGPSASRSWAPCSAPAGPALRHGASPHAAFVSGYSLALMGGAAVMFVGAAVAAIALQSRGRSRIAAGTDAG